MLLRRWTYILTLVFSLLCFGVWAENQPALPPELAAWRQIDFARYPDADTLLLDDREQITYQPDGNYTLSDDYFVYLKTEKGRDENRTFTIPFNEFYQNTPEVAIAVIRPDGSVRAIEGEQKITTEASQMQSAIFDPANKVLTLGVPDLAVGDIVHIRYQITTKHPRMQGVWCDIGVLQSSNPVLRYEYTVSAPEAMPLKSITVKDEVKGTLAFKEEKKAGRIAYTWTATNVPQIIPEPNMPPPYLCAMRVLISTAPDWETVSRWYWELCKPHLEAVSPELIAKSKELVQGKTPEAAIRAVFDFVSKEVRYTGITDENTAPGYEPHDVKQTFAQLHGVCRDKAALLAAMLREAGFEAFPVLFMAGAPKDAETPNNYFNHAITGVYLANGELVLMDATNENSSELLPAYEMNNSFLVASPMGETLKRTPEIPADKNTSRITSTGTLDKDFTLVMHTKIELTGINDAIFRGAFARWTQDDAKRFFAAMLKDALPGAELVTFQIQPEDVRDLSQPLAAELDYSLKNAVDIAWGNGLLAVPFLRFGALDYLLTGTDLETRNYPLWLESTAAIAENVTVALPENLSVEDVPEMVVSEEGAFTAKVAFELPGAHTLNASMELALNTSAVSPEEYRKLKESLKSLEVAKRARAVVSRKLDAADIAKLYPAAHIVTEKREDTLEILDAKSANLRVHEVRRVLTYGGVKGASQWQHLFYPDWEKVELVAATVTAPDGSKQEFAKSAVKIMDAPANAAAPRYPGAKIMVAALPGVVPGSVIDMEYTLERKNAPEIALVMELDAAETAVLSRTATVRYPLTLTKEIFLHLPDNGFPIADQVEDGTRSLTVTANNIPPRAQEPNAPPVWSFAPYVGITFAAPERLAENYREALENAAADSAQAALLAEKLTGDIPEMRDKVLAIRNFVAENIRPAGPDLSAVGVRAFTGADTTLRDGYGSSADRAALLYAMLCAAGVEAPTPVAVSVLPAIPEITAKLERFPLRIFDDVLLRVALDDEEFYLGDTDQYAHLGTTAHDNMLALDLASGELITIVSADECAEADACFLTIVCEADGSAKITSERSYYGTQYGTLKRLLARQTPEERKRFIQSAVKSFGEDAESLEYTASFEDYPGTVTQVVKVPAFWQQSGDYLYLALPKGTAESEIRTSTARTLPYLRHNASESTVFYAVEFPEHFQCIELAGRDFAWTAPGGNGSAVQTSGEEACSIAVRRTVKLQPMWVTPAEYPVLSEGERLLNGSAGRAILVKVSGK